uniref:Uncharacterized protein n=1 Tax=Haptolina brevifila TaxID=156173 RepID=A0A7S2BUP0_9EUKA
MPPSMRGTPRSLNSPSSGGGRRTYPSHREFTDAVGGVVPGYGGHRPGAMNTSGESAFVGVPMTMEDGPLGQGTLNTLQTRNTTAWSEIGEEYKPAHADVTDRFKDSVSGVKVGYGGHIPGAKNHYGSSHEGGVPMREYVPAGSQRPATPPPTAAELRKHTFVNAQELAQSTGTRRQYDGVRGASNSAPFGVDERVRYQTESSRTGGRNQLGASPGSQPSTPPRTPPGRFEATNVYDRDVFHGSAERDVRRFDVLNQAHVPTPPPASASGRPLAPFTNGAGELEPQTVFSCSPGPSNYQPAHTYGYEKQQAPQQSYPHSSSYSPSASMHPFQAAWAGGRAPSVPQPSTPPGSTRVAPAGSRRPASPAPGFNSAPSPHVGSMSAVVRDRNYNYSGATQDTRQANYGARTPPESFRPSWDKTAPSETVESYRGAVGGVIPGYKGFIPQTPDNVGKSDWGSMDVNNHNSHQRGHGHGAANPNTNQWSRQPAGSWDKTESSRTTDRFRDNVGGVVPGYKGFIPQTPDNVGKSDWGVMDVTPGRGSHQRGHGHGGYSRTPGASGRQHDLGSGRDLGAGQGLGAGIVRAAW